MLANGSCCELWLHAGAFTRPYSSQAGACKVAYLILDGEAGDIA
jgi:hypothetical protein